MHRDDAFGQECGLNATIKMKSEKGGKEVTRPLTRERAALK
jgi:hypothetical protein